MRYYIAGVLVALASSVGQVCFKFVSRETLLRPRQGTLRKWVVLAVAPPFVLGVALFAASAVTSVWVLRRMEFSVYYSISALNYFFIAVLARTVLREPLDRRKVTGNVIIVAGILLYCLP